MCGTVHVWSFAAGGTRTAAAGPPTRQQPPGHVRWLAAPAESAERPVARAVAADRRIVKLHLPYLTRARRCPSSGCGGCGWCWRRRCGSSRQTGRPRWISPRRRTPPTRRPATGRPRCRCCGSRSARWAPQTFLFCHGLLCLTWTYTRNRAMSGASGCLGVWRILSGCAPRRRCIATIILQDAVRSVSSLLPCNTTLRCQSQRAWLPNAGHGGPLRGTGCAAAAVCCGASRRRRRRRGRRHPGGGVARRVRGARMLLRSRCCFHVAAIMLLRSRCCFHVAAVMLLLLCCCFMTPSMSVEDGAAARCPRHVAYGASGNLDVGR